MTAENQQENKESTMDTQHEETLFVVGEGTYYWFHAEEAYHSRELAGERAEEKGWSIEEVTVKDAK